MTFGTFFISLILTLISLTKVAGAAPAALTYQGRILKADGTALEYNSVSFIFQITDPTGGCILYQEQVDGYDMTNSGGVFDTAIGTGTRNFPAAGVFSILDSLNNSVTLTCLGGSSYTPSVDDGRKLRVQFHDGTGWKVITPDNVIRSVPYAGYAASATKLGTNVASDFVLKTGIPTCGSGTFLSYDGTALSCAAVSGASGGTVTNVTSANAYLSIATGSSTPALTLNVGTTANTVAAGNDTRFTDSRAPNGTAGGDLSGTYPNPSVAKIASVGVLFTTIASGQFLKYDGTNWINATIAQSDISGLSTALSAYLTTSTFNADVASGNCTASQSMYWSSVTNAFACQAISVTSFSGSLVGDVNGTQAATSVDKIKGVSVDATAPSTGNFLRYNGTKWAPTTFASGDLPTSVTDGLWTAASGNVYRSSGSVGIGTTSPGYALDIQSASSSQASFSSTGANSSFVSVNNVTAGYQSAIAFKDAGIVKWQMGKNTDNSFFIYDQANAKSILSTSGTSISLQPAGGNVGIGVAVPGDPLVVKSAAANHNAFTVESTTGAPIARILDDAGEGGWFSLFDASSIETVRLAAIGSGSSSYINTGGNMGIGTSSPTQKLTVGGDNTWGTIESKTFGSSYYPAHIGSKANGTAAVPSTVVSGDFLGSFGASGYDGTTYLAGGSINVIADAAVSTNVLPSALTFFTNSGGTSASERMRIDHNGNVGIGTTAPSVALEVNGTIKATAFSGPLTATTTSNGAGSNTNPSMTFSGDPDTGFYDASSNDTISVAAGGAKIFDFSSAGLVSPTTGGANITSAAGTAAAPTYSFAGDPGTGWWRPAASTMAASTGGVERMRIDSSGNVGVGTTNPTYPLEVMNSAQVLRSTTGFAYLDVQSTSDTSVGDGADLRIISRNVAGTGSAIVDLVKYKSGNFSISNDETNAAAAVSISVGASEKMRVTSTGAVGIGTTTPGSLLANTNTSITDASSVGIAGLGLEWMANSTGYAGIIYNQNNLAGADGLLVKNAWGSSTSRAFTVNSAGIDNFVILGSGSVGIGTTGPLSKLNVEVANANNIDDGLTISRNAGQTYGGVRLLSNGSGQYRNSLVAKGNGGSEVEVMTFGGDSNLGGNIGMGTTAPVASLHLSGGNASSGIISDAARTDGFGTFFWGRESRGTASVPTASNSGDTVAAFAGSAHNGTAFGEIAHMSIFADGAQTTASEPGGISFATVPSGSTTSGIAERMRIANGGNVGIGTANPLYKLDVNNSSTAIAARIVGSNVDGPVTRYENTGTGGRIYHVGSTAGASGGGIGYSIYDVTATTPRFLIDGSGNLGVGTTTPAARLDVYNGGSGKDILFQPNQDTIISSGSAIRTGSSNWNVSFDSLQEFNFNIDTDGNQNGSGFNILYGGVKRMGFVPYASGSSVLTLTSSLGAANLVLDKSVGDYSYVRASTAGLARWDFGSNATTEGGANTGSDFYIRSFTDAGAYLGDDVTILRKNGYVGIGTISPSYLLDVNGTVRYYAVVNSSDIRLKKEVLPLQNSLENILKLQGVSYYWRDPKQDSAKQLGVIAQEVEKVYPELVKTGNDGFKAVNYQSLIAPVIESIKTMYAKLTDHDQEIEKLKAENAELKKLVCLDHASAEICH